MTLRMRSMFRICLVEENSPCLELKAQPVSQASILAAFSVAISHRVLRLIVTDLFRKCQNAAYLGSQTMVTSHSFAPLSTVPSPLGSHSSSAYLCSSSYFWRTRRVEGTVRKQTESGLQLRSQMCSADMERIYEISIRSRVQ